MGGWDSSVCRRCWTIGGRVNNVMMGTRVQLTALWVSVDGWTGGRAVGMGG